MLRILVQLLSFITLMSGSLNLRIGDSCSLPYGTETGKCEKLFLCKPLWHPIDKKMITDIEAGKIVKKYSVCGDEERLVVCCPQDEKIRISLSTTTSTTSTTTTTTTTRRATTTTTRPPKIDSGSLPQRSDLNAIKRHKNFRLLNSETCGTKNPIYRIIGGEEAELGEFPWMALLKYKVATEEKFSFSCGGVLITPLYVLTAAHCINRNLIGVRLGEHSLTTDEDCNHEGKCLDPLQEFEISKSSQKIRHTGYSREEGNDIALVKLNKPADLTKNNVRTICLPLRPQDQIESLQKTNPILVRKMAIAGWGLIENGLQSDVLMTAYVPYVENSECKKRFVNDFGDQLKIYPSYLCAGGEVNKTKVDTCHGDSGGPIQTISFINEDQRYFSYGVVSKGLQCENLNVKYPGVYTNLAYYLDWILDNISDTD